MLGYDYRLFQNTEDREIAKAVEDGNKKLIKQLITTNKDLINAQNLRFKHTLLMYTIWQQDYETFKLLLELGADVNLHDCYKGESAIIVATVFSDFDIKFVKELLKYGANPSDIEVGKRPKGNTTRMTPLMHASQNGNIELLEILLDAGADINYKNEYDQTALSMAVGLQKCESILYLLNQGADYLTPISFIKEQNRYYYLQDELRFFMCNLGSSDYKNKMAIVEFLKDKGIDYWSVPIPPNIIELIKQQQPIGWKYYLERY